MSSTGVVSTKNSFGEQAQRLANAALDLLFPPRCVVCKRLGSRLCAVCIADFTPIVGPVCSSCGEPRFTEGLCNRCANERRAFESVRSAFLYTGKIKPAIHALKYQNKRLIAQALSQALVANLPVSHKPETYLCPVPLHPDRQAKRGYNQSELLARGLSEIWNVPMLHEDSLRRLRNTSSQVDLDYTARQANVNGAFLADPNQIQGRAIILIDDVCTTGATLHACALTLLDVGAASVSAVTLARAV